MGRTLRVGIVGALGCLLAAMPVSANEYEVATPQPGGVYMPLGGYVVEVDNETAADPGTSGFSDFTTVACDTATRTLLGSQAGFDPTEAPNPQRAEFDPMRLSPACESMRDIVLQEAYQNGASPPPLSGCHMVNGRLNCYAFQTADCDLFLMLYGNMVRICAGGIWPYN